MAFSVTEPSVFTQTKGILVLSLSLSSILRLLLLFSSSLPLSSTYLLLFLILQFFHFSSSLPQTLRKPSSIFAPPQTILKSNTKPKPPTISKLVESPVIAQVIHSDAVQPTMVGVTSTVLEEYDPARPNHYEEYRRERKKKAMEAEVRRELDRRRLKEEEKEMKEREEREREREKDRDRDFRDVRLNIFDEEAWRRREAMSGSAAAAMAPRLQSPSSNADGFMIRKSKSGGLGIGAGGQMTAA